MKNGKLSRLLLGAFIYSSIHVTPLFCGTITANDLFVGGWLSAPNTSGIVRVDRTTHSQTLVAQGGLLADLFGIYYESPNSLLAVTPGWGNNGRIVRVDVTTGQQTLVASGLGQSTSLAFGPDGAVYVPNEGWYGPQGDVAKVDLQTGTATPISFGGRPGHLIYNSNGNMYFNGSPYPWDGGSPWVARLNPANGEWTPVATGGLLSSPGFMAEDISGDILITDMGSPFDVTDSKIIRLNPVTGEQTLLSHGQGANLNGLWIDSAGTILVSDWGDAGNTTLAGVYEVNRSTGMLTPVIQGGYLVHAGAITGLISEPVAAPECGATGALIVVGMIFLGSFRKYFR